MKLSMTQFTLNYHVLTRVQQTEPTSIKYVDFSRSV